MTCGFCAYLRRCYVAPVLYRREAGRCGTILGADSRRSCNGSSRRSHVTAQASCMKWPADHPSLIHVVGPSWVAYRYRCGSDVIGAQQPIWPHLRRWKRGVNVRLRTKVSASLTASGSPSCSHGRGRLQVACSCLPGLLRRQAFVRHASTDGWPSPQPLAEISWRRLGGRKRAANRRPQAVFLLQYRGVPNESHKPSWSKSESCIAQLPHGERRRGRCRQRRSLNVKQVDEPPKEAGGRESGRSAMRSFFSSRSAELGQLRVVAWPNSRESACEQQHGHCDGMGSVEASSTKALIPIVGNSMPLVPKRGHTPLSSSSRDNANTEEIYLTFT